ncbi:MAG: nucleotide exchange factor GrpE [Nitrospiraceae bacterium]
MENGNSLNDLSDQDMTETAPNDGQQVSDLQQLRDSLATKSDEAKANQDRYLRAVAELENYKRVSQREQRESIRYGNESILKELLPAIDNLERAIQAAKTNAGPDALIQGVELTLKQLQEAIGRFGVKPISCIGQPFDPTCQQAVTQVASERIAPGCVVDEFQKGYVLHDRVLRAAMVSVAAAASASDSESGQDS